MPGNKEVNWGDLKPQPKQVSPKKEINWGDLKQPVQKSIVQQPVQKPISLTSEYKWNASNNNAVQVGITENINVTKTPNGSIKTTPGIIERVKNSDFVTDVKETLSSIKDAKDVKLALSRGAGKMHLTTPGTSETKPITLPVIPNTPTINVQKIDTTKSLYRAGDIIDDAELGAKYGKYVNLWSNWNGQEYVPTQNVGGWMKNKNKEYDAKQMAHFLLDVDLTSGYVNPYSKTFIDKQIKNQPIVKGSTVKDQYLPVYEKLPNGNVKVFIKKATELKEGEKVAAPLRQYRYGDINWESDVKSSWNKSSSGFRTKTGEETNIIKSGKNWSGYGRFGGGSFVLIGEKNNGERVVMDIAGSSEDLYNQSKALAKITGQKVDDIVIGYHDVGSWSAKPISKSGKLGFKDMPKKSKDSFASYQHKWTGGGLAFPNAYTNSFSK